MPSPSAFVPEHSTELPAGRRLGRYLVRRRLGAGGFARVYLAWDPDLEIEVAIKVPKPQLADDPGAIDRFRREATTAARLRHPNVVTVLTVGRLEQPFDGAPADTPYLVMDYLPETLTGRLAATPILPEPEWLRIGEEVARGLAYAHAQGVVHRDVKPDNILFGRHGEAVVTDFGIARAVIEGATPASRSIVVGTPEYFSPEQARGLPLDGRTDIYGLGVTLYRAATGTLPFTGPDWYAIMRQHVEDPPPPPRAANPALSQPAEAIILRCLAKAPEDRFQNAAEVAAMLAAVAHPGALGSHPALAGGPTVDLEAPTRVAAPLPTARPVHRRRLAPMAAAAALLVAGGGAAGAWWISGRQPPVQQPVATPASPPIPSPVASPAESIAAAPPPTTPVESTPVAPVVRATGSLAIQVPAGATIVVNDRAVGAGGWHNDSLPAGRYRIRATVAALPNCATATMSSNVDLVRGDHRVVRLQPTGCGALALNVAPIHAHFTLSAGTDVVSDGALPLAQPLIVPEGDYRLVVEAPYCARYDDRVRIQSGGMRNERIRLICTQ